MALPMSLRSEGVFSPLGRALACATRNGFRLLQFSVQSDHLHVIAEADSGDDLIRGLQGLAVRCARAVNAAIGRSGTVWRGRYHVHPLTTPREVRAALVYVLLNFRKHLHAEPGIDPCSSGAWFEGWASQPVLAPPPAPVARPRSWLATTGWQRAGGRISCEECPGRGHEARPRK
jgi:putative transposase